MEGRGVPSCCPGVPGLLISSALAASSGRFLHSSFVPQNEQVEVIKDQQEILLRNNSDHAVHIPSDQEGPGPSDEDSQHEQEDETRAQGRSCHCGIQVPGVACIGRAGRRLMRCMVCDPLLTKRILVMVILAIIITTMTVLAWYFSTTHAAKSVGIVADALRSDLLARTEVTTNTLLRNVNVSSTALARLLSSPLIPGNFSSFTTLQEQVRPILFSAYSVIPQRKMVSFFGKNGLFIAYSSEYGGASILFANSTYLRPEDNSTASATEVPWSKGENLTVTRPWYKWYQQTADLSTGLPIGAVNSISPVPYWAVDFFNNTWSARPGDSWGVFPSRSNDLLVLSLSPVKQGAVSDTIGVAGVGFPVSEISKSLNNIDLHGGDVYITTVDGRLLVQTKVAVNYETGKSGTPLLPKASISNNSVVAGAAQYLASVLSNNATQPYEASNVKIGGRRYLLNSSPIEISQTTLVCVVLIPRDSLWGPSKKSSRTILAYLLTLTVCVGIVGCFFIILLTKGVSSEMRLRAALIKQLEATNQAENKSSHKSIMFASMSHDLRTPLAAILGLIDLCLCDAVESSELESNLSQMKSCATNLLDILNSILDMSKIEAGKLQLEDSEFDLLEVLEEAVEMFAVVGMMKGLEVVLDLPDDSIEKSPMVLGDPGRVKQLLSNLLSNGVKFTSQGHVVLRAWRKPSIEADSGTDEGSNRVLCGCFSSWWPWCSSEPTTTHNKHVEAEEGFAGVDVVEFEFEVDDTGKGIPRSRRKAVFENFVQVDSSVPRTHGGTGLGLGIVRSLVRLMGGDINIVDKDDPGEPGARFRFNLLLQVHRDSQAIINGETGLAREPNLEGRNREIPAREVETGTSGAAPEGTSSLGNPVALQPVTSSSYHRSPRRVDGVHVLLAMQGQAGKKAAKQWMERHGLQVWTVSHHEDFLPTLEKLKFEVFYEESFSWSECFEISSANQGFETWGSDNPVQVPEGELTANPSSRDLKRNFAEKNGPRLLLVIDTAMVSSILEVLSVSLNNSLMHGDMSTLTKVVWLVTPNTPSTIVQTLKQGTLPCDLVLHKPLNVSRLRIIWEHVLLLIQNRELGSTGNRPSPSFTVSYGGSPLGDFQGPVPPPSPTHIGTSERDPQDTASGDWHVGTVGRNDRADKQEGVGNSTPIEVSVDISADTSNLEAQPLVHTWSSPSPEVGPFPRIRSRETDIMGPPNSLKGMHILVAEDNSVLQRLTKTTLVRLGASVECVDNGLEAAQLVLANLPKKASSRSASFGSFRRVRSLSSREQSDEDNPPPAKRRPFDMVLMDCQMPVLDGYGATQRIREQEKLLGWRTPVIALTAHAMAKDESKCIEAGMDFYLTKPLATKALLTVVAKINATAERQS